MKKREKGKSERERKRDIPNSFPIFYYYFFFDFDYREYFVSFFCVFFVTTMGEKERKRDRL